MVNSRVVITAIASGTCNVLITTYNHSWFVEDRLRVDFEFKDVYCSFLQELIDLNTCINRAMTQVILSSGMGWLFSKQCLSPAIRPVAKQQRNSILRLQYQRGSGISWIIWTFKV
ncbi:hypothetical protein BLOT_006946 [Blomia tropicalis]|nr:hypothetical protein BLOT_006946 [Blomia tropicalis]